MHDESNKKSLILRLILGILILVTITTVFRLGLLDQLTLQNLQNQKTNLDIFITDHHLLAVLIFMAVYIIVVALSLPGATIMTLAGGFLFGFAGILYVVIAATVGASLCFLTARYFLGSWVQQKFDNQLKPFNTELDKNGSNYLLTLRMIPIFPFFLINLLAGLTNISLFTFFWTTMLGIIPGTSIYVNLGRSLNEIKTLSDLASSSTLIALSGLGILALIPVIYKKLHKS